MNLDNGIFSVNAILFVSSGPFENVRSSGVFLHFHLGQLVHNALKAKQTTLEKDISLFVQLKVHKISAFYFQHSLDD